MQQIERYIKGKLTTKEMDQLWIGFFRVLDRLLFDSALFRRKEE